MTLYEFNDLDEAEQIEVIWDSPNIAERIEGEYKIKLFQVDSFYVEIYRHIEHDVLKRIRSFSSTDQLQPYIGQIDVSNL
jgi:hypothetical protein